MGFCQSIDLNQWIRVDSDILNRYLQGVQTKRHRAGNTD